MYALETPFGMTFFFQSAKEAVRSKLALGYLGKQAPIKNIEPQHMITRESLAKISDDIQRVKDEAQRAKQRRSIDWGIEMALSQSNN